jgi:hypothetical protein
MEKRRLATINVQDKSIFYDKSKEISSAGYNFSTVIGVNKESTSFKVTLDATISNKARTTKYAYFKVDFIYNFDKKPKEEKEAVVLSVWDAYTTMKGIVFSNLANTSLRKLILPMVDIEEIRNSITKMGEPKKSKTKAKV